MRVDLQTKRVAACVGTGTIGAGWALLFARAGWKVRLYDSNASARAIALKHLHETSMRLEQTGLLDDSRAVMSRMSVVDRLDEAVAGAIHVQESIDEDLDSKRALFTEIDALLEPDAIAASSTSELMPSRFLEGLDNSGRMLVIHPINPPYAVPLVEIVRSGATTADTVATARRTMTSLGQHPILVQREVSGFIANRLQMAVINEALKLVGEGYCQAADVDAAISKGLGLRWSFMGPFETGHLNSPYGYLDYVIKFEPLMRSLAADLSPAYPWTLDLVEQIDRACRDMRPAMTMERRRAWRDQTLLEVRSCIDVAFKEDSAL